MKKIFFIVLFNLLTSFLVAQKNILFIAVDDLKPILSNYGSNDIITPNFDRLASLGTTFLNAHCQQAVCAPSRVSLLTGLYPDSTKVWDLSTKFRDHTPDVITLPQFFKEKGYFVSGIGKIFDGRSTYGFDSVSWSEDFIKDIPRRYFDSGLGKGFYKTHYHNPQVRVEYQARQQFLEQNENFDPIELKKLFPMAIPSTEKYAISDDAYLDGAMTNYLLEKLNLLSLESQPFFLAIGYKKPHLPFVAPKPYWDLYDSSNITPPKYIGSNQISDLNWSRMTEIRSYSDIPYTGPIPESKQIQLLTAYKACVSYIDAQLGKVLDRMDSLKLLDNTTIVLWGDHGWHLGDHGLWDKRTILEQSVRSPLIIVDPVIGLKNNLSNSPVELIDIYPTLCELTGSDCSALTQGKSLIPIMNDPRNEVREAALSQINREKYDIDYMGYTLRDKRYRYIKWLELDYRDGQRKGKTVSKELFDLVNDPMEENDLSHHPDFSNTVSYFEKIFQKRNVAQGSNEIALAKNKVTVFSNPSKGVINIISRNNISSIHVISLNGKLIKEVEGINQLNYTFELETPESFYILKVIDHLQNIWTSKIIRENK